MCLLCILELLRCELSHKVAKGTVMEASVWSVSWNLLRPLLWAEMWSCFLLGLGPGSLSQFCHTKREFCNDHHSCIISRFYAKNVQITKQLATKRTCTTEGFLMRMPAPNPADSTFWTLSSVSLTFHWFNSSNQSYSWSLMKWIFETWVFCCGDDRAL